MKILVLLGICTVAVACATGPSAPAYVPDFSYSPAEQAPPGSVDVTLAIVAPSFSEEASWTRVSPFRDFSDALAADFNELVAARGVTTRGPFESYENMLFPDKEGSDLVLVPSLDLDVDIVGIERRRTELLSGKIQLKGTALVDGRVELWLLESLTGTRMWTKNVDVDRLSVPWEGETWFDDSAWSDGAIMADQGFVNAVAPELEKLYGQVLSMAWDYLNPDEMQVVKEQSLEVRKRAVIVGN